MRRGGLIVVGGAVLALLLGGVFAANSLALRDDAGTPLQVDPVVATPDPRLPSVTPVPTPTVEPSLAPVPPAPPEDVNDVDDDDDDLDDENSDDDGL